MMLRHLSRTTAPTRFRYHRSKYQPQPGGKRERVSVEETIADQRVRFEGIGDVWYGWLVMPCRALRGVHLVEGKTIEDARRRLAAAMAAHVEENSR